MLNKYVLIEGREEEGRWEENDEQAERRVNSHQHSSDSSGENMKIAAIRRTVRPKIIPLNATAMNLGCKWSLIRSFCC